MRRAGFAASMAAGLALMALSVGGMANLDEELQAAAQPPANERVVLETGEVVLRDRDCDRRDTRRPHRSTDAA